jgi:hypothetical protein
MAKQQPPPPVEQQTMTVLLDQKQIADLRTKGPKDLADAQEFTIETVEDYEASGSFLSLLAERQKKVLDFFEEPAKQANSVHKFITNLRSMLVLPYQQAESIVKQRRQAWRTLKEQERQEKERQEREKAKAENEALALEEAKQLEQMGEHEAASVVIERAVNAPPPPVIVQSVVPKQAGLSVKTVWKFRFKNFDLIKKEFWIPDESKIGAIVSKLGPDAATIVGGIEVYSDEIESVRRK